MAHNKLLTQTTSIIDQEWPEKDVEHVLICPMCESERRTLVHSGVKDWAFNCAPGSWNYWRCGSCDSLYVDARPTEASIWRAYAHYYTHAVENSCLPSTLLKKIVGALMSIKQGYLNFALGTNLPNSIRFPSYFYRILDKLELLPRIFLQDIRSSKPGRMLDLGCGDGRLMLIAKRYGWDVEGLEQDNAAVQSARKKGLVVHLGSYQDIVGLDRKFDLIVCSHVIEHVHDPRKLISLAFASLEESGQLWLQWPNPKSDGLRKYGVHWRGLEAPRHISLPSVDSIQKYARSIEPAFVVKNNSESWKWAQISMYEASEKIKKSGSSRIGHINFLRAALRFLLTKSNIAECELCTVTTIKKTT